ncbi:hypothetical protein HYH03_001899 [Edaphochlamys debaryana]|uniref:BTB domain-containing protein n=1 Tax=Edaphochlamys debaryana TaxID=47281 RepID=A0A836C5R5_9CHLO|nr:hypothetical protein HYH03_001899 [Edaphochlamys debaryana]|eukprot:KAG2500323.1 hypothetical protein HYH03_001899 [Edaphochlamys debaryana]
MTYILKASVPIPSASGVVSRAGDAPQGVEALVANLCGELRPIFGAEARGPLETGPPLTLIEATPREGEPPPLRRLSGQLPSGLSRARGGITGPIYDAFSDSIFAVNVRSIVRIVSVSDANTPLARGDANAVVHIAGQRSPGPHRHETRQADGPGPSARFHCPCFLASDGRGCIYVADDTRIRQLQLPPSLAAPSSASSSTSATVPGTSSRASSTSQPPGSYPWAQGQGSASEAEAVAVTTLPLEAPAQIWGLLYEDGRGRGDAPSLIYATATAIYRYRLGAGDARAGAAEPELLAGREGVGGSVDGHGTAALLGDVYGIALDGDGCIYAAEVDNWQSASALRRIDPDGHVTTIASGLEGLLCRPGVLPSGYLALCGRDHMLVLDLGLKPPRGVGGSGRGAGGPGGRGGDGLGCSSEDGAGGEGRAGAGGKPRRTLHADMGALLDRQPDGTADLTLVVGDRRFPVHRAILIARSDYFQQRLEGGFADGAAAELSLPDADPDAFALVLRWLYTGAVDIPAALAPAVAELADRLLLPELCSDAQAVVLSGVEVESVVDSLLWAERCGHAFAPLLTQLKAWYLAHHEEVVDRAPSGLRRLATEAPDLMVALVTAYTTRRGTGTGAGKGRARG